MKRTTTIRSPIKDPAPERERRDLRAHENNEEWTTVGASRLPSRLDLSSTDHEPAPIPVPTGRFEVLADIIDDAQAEYEAELLRVDKKMTTEEHLECLGRIVLHERAKRMEAEKELKKVSAELDELKTWKAEKDRGLARMEGELRNRASFAEILMKETANNPLRKPPVNAPAAASKQPTTENPWDTICRPVADDKREVTPMTLLFFEGCRKMYVPDFRKAIVKLGIWGSTMRSIVFLTEDLVQIMIYADNKDNLVRKLTGANKAIKYLPDCNPMLGSTYSKHGDITDAEARASYLAMMTIEQANLEAAAVDRDYLRRPAAFLKRVIETECVTYTAPKRASCFYMLGNYIPIKELPKATQEAALPTTESTQPPANTQNENTRMSETPMNESTQSSEPASSDITMQTVDLTVSSTDMETSSSEAEVYAPATDMDLDDAETILPAVESYLSAYTVRPSKTYSDGELDKIFGDPRSTSAEPHNPIPSPNSAGTWPSSQEMEPHDDPPPPPDIPW